MTSANGIVDNYEHVLLHMFSCLNIVIFLLSKTVFGICAAFKNHLKSNFKIYLKF